MMNDEVRMMKYISLSVLAAALLSACGSDETVTQRPAVTRPAPAAAVTVSTAAKQVPPRYKYSGDRFRDPFIALDDSGMSVGRSEDLITPSIGSLTLKGILEDGDQKMAIISGGGMTYMLKDGKLYDSRQRLIRGVTGAIKKDSVIMIAPDKTSKELTLRQKE